MDAVMEKMESPLGSSFSMNPRQYFVFCVLLGSAAYGIGYALVDYLRLCCRTYKNIQRLAAVVFLTPFFIFVILNVLLFLGFAERMLCDALSFGVAVGILFRLSYKPSGPSTIKLVSQEINGRTVDVWLDTLDEPMGDVSDYSMLLRSFAFVTRTHHYCYSCNPSGRFAQRLPRLWASPPHLAWPSRAARETSSRTLLEASPASWMIA